MKHSLNVHTLAAETAAMDPAQSEKLMELAEEALELHTAFMDRIVCGKPHEDEPDGVQWARKWRKEFIEPLYYACQVRHSGGKVKEAPPPPQSTCVDLQEARRIHARFLHEPEDPKTGSHNWHRRWVRVYRDTEQALGCRGAPPPTPCPGLPKRLRVALST